MILDVGFFSFPLTESQEKDILKKTEKRCFLWINSGFLTISTTLRPRCW